MTNYLTGHEPVNELIAHLLDATPRPGGYVKFPNKSKTNNGSTTRNDDPKITRQLYMKQSSLSDVPSMVYRLPPSSFVCNDDSGFFHPNSLLEMSPSQIDRASPADWEVTAYDDASKNDLGDIVDDGSCSMLAVTISLVMLLASGVKRIQEEYYVWAESYLTCIKDETGQHPPNVLGLLRMIRELQSQADAKVKAPQSQTACACADTKEGRAVIGGTKADAKVRRTQASANFIVAEKRGNRAFERKVKKPHNT